MGAMPWSIIGPYDRDPKVALAKVQRKYFDHNCDLPAVIEQQVRSMESAVANCREDDEYGLLGTFTANLNAIKRIARRPIPDDQDAQIRMLRKLVNAVGEPLNNILDIEGVSKETYPWCVFPLPEATVQEYFGTPRPSQMIAGNGCIRCMSRLTEPRPSVSRSTGSGGRNVPWASCMSGIPRTEHRDQSLFETAMSIVVNHDW